jgi:hypothetical protein
MIIRVFFHMVNAAFMVSPVPSPLLLDRYYATSILSAALALGNRPSLQFSRNIDSP